MRMVLLAATLSVSLIGAEAQPKITVVGQGSTKVLPTALEVMITLTEKSEDAKGALLNLKATRDKIAAKLTPLGVSADQVKADTATVVDMQGNRRQQQMRGGNRLKRSEKTAEAKPEVQMQQVVRARIPIKGKDVDAITLESEDLKAKVKAAKLIEEKKEDEAEAEDPNEYNNNQTVSPISMYFVADLNPEMQEAALADAVKKATENAARIAKAMGKGAPELMSVTLHSAGQENANNYNYEYNEWGGRQQYQQRGPQDGIYSFTPSINYQTMLTAEYRVK